MFLEALLIRFSSKIEVVTDYDAVISSVSVKITDTLLKLLVWSTKTDEYTLLMRFMTNLSKFVPYTQIQCM